MQFLVIGYLMAKKIFYGNFPQKYFCKMIFDKCRHFEDIFRQNSQSKNPVGRPFFAKLRQSKQETIQL